MSQQETLALLSSSVSVSHDLCVSETARTTPGPWISSWMIHHSRIIHCIIYTCACCTLTVTVWPSVPLSCCLQPLLIFLHVHVLPLRPAIPLWPTGCPQTFSLLHLLTSFFCSELVSPPNSHTWSQFSHHPVYTYTCLDTCLSSRPPVWLWVCFSLVKSCFTASACLCVSIRVLPVLLSTIPDNHMTKCLPLKRPMCCVVVKGLLGFSRRTMWSLWHEHSPSRRALDSLLLVVLWLLQLTLWRIHAGGDSM